MGKGVVTFARLSVFVLVVFVIVGAHAIFSLRDAKNDAEKRLTNLRSRFSEQRELYLKTDAKIDTLMNWLRPKQEVR